MPLRDFFRAIIYDIFLVAFASFLVFTLLDFFQPGLISTFLHPAILPVIWLASMVLLLFI